MPPNFLRNLKGIEDKYLYISNNDNQNQSFCKLNVTNQSRFNKSTKIFEPTNERSCLHNFGTNIINSPISSPSLNLPQYYPIPIFLPPKLYTRILYLTWLHSPHTFPNHPNSPLHLLCRQLMLPSNIEKKLFKSYININLSFF